MNVDSKANSKIVVQCENEELLNTTIAHILDRFSECVVYDTNVRPNTREPFVGGVHRILFLTLEAVDIE